MLSADISVGTCTEDMARTSKREASKKHLGNICIANWAVADSIVTYKDWELTSQGSQPYQRPGLQIIQVSKGYPAVSVIKSTLGILNRNRTKAKETDPKGIRL
ncbi:hypothetical protein D5086_026340 [Populus alba]|uniref:Uncharacterized protein n=1 Tax=Populus alba TaxID=43335 RepID=A0ACC4B2F4_POPAL